MDFFDTRGAVAHRLSAHAQVKDSMIGLHSKFRSAVAGQLAAAGQFQGCTQTGVQPEMGGDTMAV